MIKSGIITGSSKGIGRAIAIKMSELGYNIVINYAKDSEQANNTYQYCKSINPKTLLCKADVSQKDQVKALVEIAKENFGGIDFLINNAGINKDRPFLDLTEKEWDEVVNINMKGTFLVSQMCAKVMMEQDQGGHIINIAATTGITGRKNGISYCASKSGIIAMTKCMAKELGPKVRVNTVIPGFTHTDEVVNRFNLITNLQKEIDSRKIPLNRIGEPEEVAELITYLLSDKANYINGQKFIIDGGECMI